MHITSDLATFFTLPFISCADYAQEIKEKERSLVLLTGYTSGTVAPTQQILFQKQVSYVHIF